MSNIITPSTLWNNFDSSLAVSSINLKTRVQDGVVYEHVAFLGRDTGDGRVKIYAVYATDEKNPSASYVMLFNDSVKGVDYGLIRFFVSAGYSVLMVDYRGEWDGADAFTLYPTNVDYANTLRCQRRKDFVDETADKTSWYEWVAVGVYARKYLKERTGSEDIAVVGIRDGGEIVWKLAMVEKFKCAVAVCAAGWKAYAGVSKFKPDEHELDEERYRFIAGIDSQAYAPFVKCPVLMLCSTNDGRFDYDRAYDTFSRINPEYAQDSVIAYSVRCDATVGVKSTSDMLMFLDKHLKHRHVFIPKPVEVNVCVDSEDNLVARAVFDEEGVVEECGMYMAEDCIDTSLRDWTNCPVKRKISDKAYEFSLNIYEKTSALFVLCYAKYSNGFTVWSKIVVKKISGSFRNNQHKCRAVFTAKEGADGFNLANPEAYAIGGIFLDDNDITPRLVTKAKGIKGISSVCGLTTYRFNSPRYAPDSDSVLKLDIYCDETADVTFVLQDVDCGETYKYTQSVLGGVWQSLIFETKMFKSENLTSPADFARSLKFSVYCDKQYAVNNVMWL